MKNNKARISVSTILLIVAIIVIIAMGYVIYTLYNSKTEADKQIEELKAETENMQTTLTTIQNYLNNNMINEQNDTTNQAEDVTNENTTTSEGNTATTVKTEKEKAEEVAKAFVKAVNEKDWSTAEKYSNSNVVNSIKKYNVYNMSIDWSTLQEMPEKRANGYYCKSSYDFEYEGITNKKEVGLGEWFCMEKVNETFTVTAFGATGV